MPVFLFHGKATFPQLLDIRCRCLTCLANEVAVHMNSSLLHRSLSEPMYNCCTFLSQGLTTVQGCTKTSLSQSGAPKWNQSSHADPHWLCMVTEIILHWFKSLGCEGVLLTQHNLSCLMHSANTFLINGVKRLNMNETFALNLLP